MKIWKIALAMLILCSGLLLAGCNGAPIQVKRAKAVEGESSLNSQWLELNNCEGETELHRSLAEEEPVICTITISDTATIGASGQTLELTSILKTELTEQIELAYQQEYEEAKNLVQQDEMIVPVGRVHLYEISWKQRVFSSTVRFIVDEKTYTAAYTYTLDIPDAILSTRKACKT